MAGKRKRNREPGLEVNLRDGKLSFKVKGVTITVAKIPRKTSKLRLLASERVEFPNETLTTHDGAV